MLAVDAVAPVGLARRDGAAAPADTAPLAALDSSGGSAATLADATPLAALGSCRLAGALADAAPLAALGSGGSAASLAAAAPLAALGSGGLAAALADAAPLDGSHMGSRVTGPQRTGLVNPEGVYSVAIFNGNFSARYNFDLRAFLDNFRTVLAFLNLAPRPQNIQSMITNV